MVFHFRIVTSKIYRWRKMYSCKYMLSFCDTTPSIDLFRSHYIKEIRITVECTYKITEKYQIKQLNGYKS